MNKRIKTVVTIIILIFYAAIFAQQVEKPEQHKMWLLHTTHKENAPSVFYYKFQYKNEMTCIAVFQSHLTRDGGTNFITETSWGPAVSVALTSQKVPCE